MGDPRRSKPRSAPLLGSAIKQLPRVHGESQPWAIGEVFSLAFQAYKRDWLVLTLAQFVPQVIWLLGSAVSWIARDVYLQTDDFVGAFVSTVLVESVNVAVAVFFMIGQIRIGLCAARQEPVRLALLFSGADRFLPMCLVFVLWGTGVVLGSLLLILPGIVLVLAWSLCFYFVVEGECVDKALAMSWNSTKGHRGQLLLFVLVSVAVVAAGFISSCVGIFSGAAVSSVAVAIVYTRLSGTTRSPLAGAGWTGA